MITNNITSQLNTVPIVITTLCRYEHFTRCIESLKKCALAGQTDLYVGLDYPFKEVHWDGYNKISAYLNDLTGFNSVNVIKHDSNVGSSANYHSILDVVLNKYDRYIYTEDDNEFSPCFLEYINKVMAQYENEEDVIAVSGYNYPVDMSDIEGNVYSLDTYFSAYGYGTWKSRKEKCEQACNYNQFRSYFLNYKKMRELYHRSPNQFCNFVKGMIGYIPWMRDGKKIKTIDLSFGLYLFFENKRMIFPTISKSRNWGFDGTGEHCDISPDKNSKEDHRNYDFSSQEIDENDFNDIRIIDSKYSRIIDSRLNDFFTTTLKERIISIIAYRVFYIYFRFFAK